MGTSGNGIILCQSYNRIKWKITLECKSLYCIVLHIVFTYRNVSIKIHTKVRECHFSVNLSEIPTHLTPEISQLEPEKLI